MVTVSDTLKVWVEENPDVTYDEILDKLKELLEEYDKQNSD